MSNAFYSPPQSLSVLRTWLDERGAQINDELRIEDGQFGWGMQSTEAIRRGATLCSVPKTAILSYRTASLASIIPLQPEDAADAILCLTACLLHELRLGKQSNFYGCLQILPRETIILPTFWEDADLSGPEGAKALELLKGTEADRELQRKNAEGLSLNDLKEFYERLAPHLPPTAAHPTPSPFSAFAYACSMVSTRGFVIDTYHTIGLIPYCDMFNHSTTGAHTSLATTSSVCGQCGSFAKCEHDELDQTPDRLAGLKHEPDERDNIVEMLAERDVPAGEEVMSCYEENIGDAKLLVEWGFISGAGARSGLTWSHRELLQPHTIRAFIAWANREAAQTESAPQTFDDPASLKLSYDGTFGVGIIAAVALSCMSDTEIADVEAGHIDPLKTIIDGLRGRSSPSGSAVIEQVAEKMLGLVSARRQGLSSQEFPEEHENSELIRNARIAIQQDTAVLEAAKRNLADILARSDA